MIYLKFIFFCIASLSLIVAATGYGYDERTGILSVPIRSMESGLELLMRKGADIKLIEGLYDWHKRVSVGHLKMVAGKPQPSNDTLPLYKYFDTQYYGMVNIGKPGHTFKMIMDTAWGYSWVISSDCPQYNMACDLHERYNHKSSSTYKPDGTKFNLTSLVGYLSEDTFLVGQMSTTGQKFAEITSLPWIYSLYKADGVIGLGFKELTENYIPFFYNFFTQNTLKEFMFSFYINRDPTTPRGGSLFFGGIDTKHNKTAFTSLKVNSQYYWQVPMEKVTVIRSKTSKVYLCKGGCNATTDTSSITIQGPEDEIKQINKLIGAEKPLFSDRYLISCLSEFKGPKISFTLNGTEFTITAKDYIQKLSYSGFMVCLSAFQPAPKQVDPNMWILGGAFLYQFYTAFDIRNRVVLIAEAA